MSSSKQTPTPVPPQYKEWEAAVAAHPEWANLGQAPTLRTQQGSAFIKEAIMATLVGLSPRTAYGQCPDKWGWEVADLLVLQGAAAAIAHDVLTTGRNAHPVETVVRWVEARQRRFRPHGPTLYEDEVPVEGTLYLVCEERVARAGQTVRAYDDVVGWAPTPACCGWEWGAWRRWTAHPCGPAPLHRQGRWAVVRAVPDITVPRQGGVLYRLPLAAVEAVEGVFDTPEEAQTYLRGRRPDPLPTYIGGELEFYGK